MTDGGPLDMSKDPDRYDPSRDPSTGLPPQVEGHSGPTQDRTLPELLGEGAHEDDRVGMEWLAGLVAVLLFLALFAYLFAEVLNPA